MGGCFFKNENPYSLVFNVQPEFNMKPLNKSHSAILAALTESPLTKNELKLATGQSPDGLRGRISEMRKLGYEITLQEPKEIEKKYYLISLPVDKKTNEVLEWLEEKSLFGSLIPISKISSSLGIAIEDVESIIADLFETHSVVQLSQTTVKISKRQT